jgi:glycosyltransferase involved in cell wall biosynthesis
LPADLPVEVVHNGFAEEPPKGIEQSPAVPRLHEDSLRIAFVGNLIRVKGIFEFVKAAKIVRDKGLNVDFLVAGDNPVVVPGIRGWLLKKLGLASNVRLELEEFVTQNRLQDRVHFLGFVSDIRKVYAMSDVLCFPTMFDAVGRPVFEAAHYALPSIVAISEPMEDTFIDRETGLAIDDIEPATIARAIEYCAAHPDELKRMGEAARQHALRNFDSKVNARQMLAIYHAVAGPR